MMSFMSSGVVLVLFGVFATVKADHVRKSIARKTIIIIIIFIIIIIIFFFFFFFSRQYHNYEIKIINLFIIIIFVKCGCRSVGTLVYIFN